MSQIQAVIFDLDDTLFSEREFALSGYAAVASAFAEVLGDPEKSAARMAELLDSEHRGRVFNVLLQERGVPVEESLIQRMIGVYRTHPPTIHLHPDADAALTALRPHYSLGIITDGPAAMQAKKLDALGLRNRVDECILTGEWGRKFWKPHPRAFEEMARRLSVPHEACVYVADNPSKDFVAPNRIGWRTIQVTRPGGVYAGMPAVAGGEAGMVVEDLGAVAGCAMRG